MRTGWRTAVVAFAGVFVANAFAEPPETFRLRASVAAPLSQLPLTEVTISEEGAASITQTVPKREQFGLQLQLTADETAELCRAVTDSRFFEAWTPAPCATDMPTWTVTVALGHREMKREVHQQDEFAPLGQQLWRYVQQVETMRSLRNGDAARIALEMRDSGFRSRLLRPGEIESALPDALVRSIVTSEDGTGPATGATNALLELLPPDSWIDRVRQALAVLEDERRFTFLADCASGAADPERIAYRTVFAPLALAEVRRAWKSDWDRGLRHDALDRLLAIALKAGEPDALTVAADVLRAKSTKERAFLPRGLTEIGIDAVPLVETLLDDPDPVTRCAAARLAAALFEPSRSRANIAGRLADRARSDLVAQFDSHLVPLLKRVATQPDEPYFVREACFRALDARDGRDRERERRTAAQETARRSAQEAAARKALEERARPAPVPREPPPPRGELSISGRLTGPQDVGLGGFDVSAERDDGPPADPLRRYGSSATDADGAFRIDGLVPGEFRVVARHPTWSWRTLSRNSSAVEGVRAGTADLALRFVGSLLRGRVTDETGKGVSSHLRRPCAGFRGR